jgi:hypothetical protein
VADQIVTMVNEHATALDSHDATVPGTPSFTIGAQTSSHRDVTIQLKDASGTALAVKALARVWVSDTAGGGATAAAPAGGTSVQTGTTLVAVTANKVFDIISNASGQIVVRLTDATGSINTNWYVNAASGNLVASSAAVNITNA